MAIDHVCWQCGLDLARQRPQRDPHYGLPLVHCPRCAWSCVRRRHPLHVGWRKAMRIGKAVATLILQMGLLAMMTAMTLGLTNVIRFHSSWLTDPRQASQSEMLPIVGVMAITVFIGVWLGSMFAFRNVFSTFGLWVLWIAGVLAIESMGVRSVYNALHALVGSDVRWIPRPDLWWSMMQIVGMMTVVSLLGWPIGRGAALAYTRFRASRRRSLRRRRRFMR